MVTPWKVHRLLQIGIVGNFLEVVELPAVESLCVHRLLQIGIVGNQTRMQRLCDDRGRVHRLLQIGIVGNELRSRTVRAD